MAVPKKKRSLRIRRLRRNVQYMKSFLPTLGRKKVVGFKVYLG
uniref:Ribosomal protein L32 n=1 Tax=Ophirina amphinema TaxID=2108040 RepID=A0A348AYU9_9EUKA|nr:ribosomal protein L32 [Ophirina amphinema]